MDVAADGAALEGLVMGSVEVKRMDIPATPMVLETSYSVRSLGSHASSMVMYRDGDFYQIEWDIPTLDMVEHIGLVFDGKALADYDGVFSLPKEAVQLIRSCGFTVGREFL